MIESSCTCGAPLVVPESDCQTRVTCRSCGEGIRIVCAEALPDGAGAGDFDARLLILSSPNGSGEQLLLGGVEPIEIGKLPQRQIVFDGNLVSRLHARLVRLDFGPSRWEIYDNSSTNGVFVNDERVTRHELQFGDAVRIGEYELRFGPAELVPAELPTVAPAVIVATPRRSVRPVVEASTVWDGIGGVPCPSCRTNYAPAAKICVACGIYIATGRPVITSKGFDESDLAIRADTWIRLVSWVVPFGLFPVASEAFGTKKPYAIWTIAALTLLVTVGYWVANFNEGENGGGSPASKNLLLWTRSEASTAELRPALKQRLHEELQSEDFDKRIRRYDSHSIRPDGKWVPVDPEEDELIDSVLDQAYPRGVGFHWYQLFTHALLHADIMHIAGNMLFLLVFGLRVNEVIGNLRTAIIYPILAALSGIAYILANLNAPSHALLGASGAIMGLAGMYFIFFPLQRVHTAIWLRIGWRIPCMYKMFTMRGFWLLVLWIAFNDGLPMVLAGKGDNVAHWAHLGGFMCGAAIAIGLLVARQANTHGGDLISVALGKHAWAILGKPSTRLNVLVTPETRGTAINYPA